jgi:tetratricopeptide (TPR) repeat protein
LLLLPVCGVAAQLSPAEILIQSGHWKRARVLVEVRIRENPNDALANFLLSQVRNAFGYRETPLPLAEKAVALDGHVAKYHRQLAEALGVTAQHSNAIELLFLAHRFRKEIDTALALDGGDPQALRDLLEFYLVAPSIAGGDPGKAEGLARQIGQIKPSLGFMAEARIAEFHKRAGEAEKLLRSAVEAPPASYEARMALARFYLDPAHFDADGAEKEAQAALEMDRSRAGAYTVLAEALAHRGAWNELEVTLTAGAAAVPDDLAPYYRAADRLASDGRELDRAERYLKTYLAQEPEGNEPTAAEATGELKRIHRK